MQNITSVKYRHKPSNHYRGWCSLEYHADFCDLISDWMRAKARGEIELTKNLYEKARVETGKLELEIQSYFDHNLYFGEYIHTQNMLKSGHQYVLNID